MDVETVRHALAVARRNGFAEVELRSGDDRFRARLEPVSPDSARRMVQAVDAGEPALAEIKSPLVGYYRNGRTPLALGQSIKAGDRIASVEALGLLSDVEAKQGGEVVELLVEDGQAVQFGQVLARVKP
ncbi:biotin/lipoyl-binding protein [bacterium]|nr:MAG: biotin/lipoyl-binding protein [bacterium]